MNRLLVSAVLLAATRCFAEGAHGPIPDLGLPRPNEIRIAGYIGEKPPGTVPETTWVVECLGKEYPFHVTRLQVLVGDLSYTDIIEEAKPYRVAFILRADDASLERFASTPPGQKIAVTAYQRTGSRDLLVAAIEQLPAAAPPQ